MHDGQGVAKTSFPTSENGSRSLDISKRIFSWLNRSQVGLDFFAVLSAFYLANFIYVDHLQRVSPLSREDFGLLAWASSAAFCLLLDRVGMYRQETSILNISELRGVFRGTIYFGGLLLATSFYFRRFDLSRLTISFAMLFIPVFLLAERAAMFRFRLFLFRKGIVKRLAWIYGAGKVGSLLAKRMLDSPGMGVLPLAFLDDDTKKHHTRIQWPGIRARDALPIIGGGSELERAKSLGIETVYIAFPSSEYAAQLEAIKACTRLGLDYAVVPSIYDQFILNVETIEIAGIPILRKRVTKTDGPYRFFKRLFDFVMAIFLLTLLLPVFAAVALWLKLDSSGPVFFKQFRVGQNGENFLIWKFRSMVATAEKYAVNPASPEDPRITRAGRWLRRTSLDELPQLINVLIGNMSLVGPRPEMPFIVETYGPIERLRLEMKPGITGIWQISAARGAAIHENMEYDLFYLRNRSMLLDIAILAKTFWSVMMGLGAV